MVVEDWVDLTLQVHGLSSRFALCFPALENTSSEICATCVNIIELVVLLMYSVFNAS